MDRNFLGYWAIHQVNKSLSARRAWIEISGVDFSEDWLNVALRKESVDRNNLHCVDEVSGDTWSLSARRAWIEIGH